MLSGFFFNTRHGLQVVTGNEIRWITNYIPWHHQEHFSYELLWPVWRPPSIKRKRCHDDPAKECSSRFLSALNLPQSLWLITKWCHTRPTVTCSGKQHCRCPLASIHCPISRRIGGWVGLSAQAVSSDGLSTNLARRRLGWRRYDYVTLLARTMPMSGHAVAGRLMLWIVKTICRSL